MNFDFNDIYKKFDAAKSIYDFSEYVKEIIENNHIIENFSRTSAIKQTKKLTAKYGIEFNILALIYQNGKNVVPEALAYSKSDDDLRNDLIYANNHIPLFAIERAGLEKILSDYK